MLHKRHNSLITLFLLLALVGVSKPAKAFLLAQSDNAPTTFSLPDKLAQDAEVQIAASNSTSSINESLTEGFNTKYPKAQVNIATQDSDSALQSLSKGTADLVSIGRSLTPDEKAQGFIEVPISREKIAIVISKDNSYDGNLTITQFAQIFRGEITDWSEIDGAPGKINLVDMPASNDTRQAFPNYPVFQSAEFSTGSNSVQLEEDSTDAMIAQLGANGISYAVANDVIDRDDVQIVTMHQTKPDNPKYPFSQPFSLVYKGTPSEAAQAYLGFATAEGGEQVIASRVGSISTAAAIASGLASTPGVNNSDTTTAPQTEADADGDVDAPDPDAVADADGDVDAPDPDVVADADADVDAPDPDVVADADADVDAPDPDAVADADADVDAPDPDAVVDADADVDAPDPDVVVDADGDVDAPDPDAVADVDGDVDAPDPDVVADADGDVDASDPDVVVDADADVDAPDPDVVVDADGDVDAPDLDVVADADVEGSGEINPEVDDSGEINPDIDDSGEIEITPEVDGSGELNPDLQDSGALNPDVEGSGELNPDIESSGDPLSSENLEIDGEANPDAVIADGDGTTPNTVEGETSGEQAIAKKGKWWWWLPLILGIPLLVLGAMFAFGGRKKSDQEPAISNIPNPDNGGVGLGGGTNGGNMSAIGANRSGNLGNVANTTSKLGNAAIATGGAALAGGAAAAANLVGGKKSVENDADIDLELDEPGTVTEIPSNSVTEFTDQETKLQTDVTDNLDNLNDVSSGFTNDISAGATGLGAAAVGGAVASGFLGDSETSTEETTTDFVVEGESRENIELDTNVSELQTDQTTDLEDRGNREFSGDFVLDEETKNSLASEQDTDLNISRINVPGIDTPELNNDINLDLAGKTTDATEGISGTVSGAVDGIQTPEIDVPELDLPNVDANLSGDTGTGIVDKVTESGGAAIAGGAAALGGTAAAASGFFNRNQDNSQPVDAEFTSEQDTDLDVSGIDVPGIDTPELNNDINLDLAGKATDATEGISGAVSGTVDGIKTPELDLPNVDVNLSGDTETGIVDKVTESGGAAIAGGAAAFGGAAAAASGFFNRNQDNPQPVDAEFTLEQDTDLNVPEINVPGINVPGINTPELNTDINLDLAGKATDATEGISGAVDGIKTPELDLPNVDVNLSGDTGTGIVDKVTESGGAALAGGAAAFGGAAAAASGFFNRNQDNQQPVDAEFTAELDDVDLSLETGSIDGANSLEDITLDDAANMPEVSLEEITFDDGTNTSELSLEEIAFDDADTRINASLEEITFDDGTNTSELSLDEIAFDATETQSTSSQNVNLDDLGFEESTNSTTSDLLSNKTAEITSLSDDPSNDMNNITEWLDSLETPTQSTDNISEWLDTLNTDNVESAQKGNDKETTMDLPEEADDISFKFLEDLLDRDSNSQEDNQ